LNIQFRFVDGRTSTMAVATHQTLRDVHAIVAPSMAGASFRLICNGKLVPNSEMRVDTLFRQDHNTVYVVPRNELTASQAVQDTQVASEIRSSAGARSASTDEIRVEVALGEETKQLRLAPALSSVETLAAQLRALFGDKYHVEMALQYVDSDGDRITVESNSEWQEAVRELKKQGDDARMFVGERRDRVYFRDAAPPKVMGFYEEAKQSGASVRVLLQAASDDASALQSAVTQCIANQFPNGKILPYNLPAWLQDAVRVVSRNVAVADIDVDIERLWNVMTQRSLALFDEREYSAARDLLVDLTNWRPTSAVSWYNLACANSLLADVDAALSALDLAFRHGYKNLAHTLVDPDLANLRAAPKFATFIDRIIETLSVTK